MNYIISLITALTLILTPFTSLVNIKAVNKNNDNLNIIVLFKENKIDPNVETLISKSGGNISSKLPELGCIEAECSSKIIEEIESKDSVEALSQNNVILFENTSNSNNSQQNNNDESSNSNSSQSIANIDVNTLFSGDLYEKYQWDIKQVTNNGQSFDIESGNHNIVVGIIDSGVDTDHPDLKNNLLGGKNLVPSNFQNDATETGSVTDIEDRLGHGTQVSGQIAANGKIKGIAPNIGFKSYRIFNKYGQTTVPICAKAILEAVNDNVKIINLSFGSYYLDGECTWTDSATGEIYNLGSDMAQYLLLQRAIQYAANNNVIIVTASGNDNLNCSDTKGLTDHFNYLYEYQGFKYTGSTYQAPGCLNGVINVSAVDKNKNLASYSNYGQGVIDITAPSGDIDDGYDINNLCITTDMNGSYVLTFGTSFFCTKSFCSNSFNAM